MPKLPIYMDCHATTPTDPRVVEAMLPWFTEKFGNAASTNHSFGWAAEEAVDRAREQVAHLIGAQSREIIFTSGATESNNLAIKGPARLHGTKRNHIITVVTEHRAVLDPCRSLERDGCEVTYLPVDSNGLLDPKEIAAAITEKTLLVSVMIANNEIGTLQPIEEIGEICKTKEVYFHTDAAQAVGKIPVNVQTMGIDLLSISGHKLYSPKGIGGLYIRSRGPRVRLEPMIDGGGHERGLRSGTLPVPLIVGLGEAARIASEEMSGESERLANLKNRLHDRICAEVPDVMLNGHPKSRLPGNLNLSFPGVNGEALLMRLKHVAVSSGSACTSAEPEPSYVLRALGVDEEMAHSSLRFGLGRFNTEEEVDWVAAHVGEQVRALREMAVK